jgi:hypothetical protein
MCVCMLYWAQYAITEGARGYYFTNQLRHRGFECWLGVPPSPSNSSSLSSSTLPSNSNGEAVVTNDAHIFMLQTTRQHSIGNNDTIYKWLSAHTPSCWLPEALPSTLLEEEEQSDK